MPSKVDAERKLLADAQSRGTLYRLAVFTRLSGPGWMQSAITLGGGSLASSLYLGVLTGTALLWVQPAAMILGIVMLSGIAYVTLTTGERPFRAINRHVNPVLGWSWALAALAANMFWCLPQYALADGVLQQNLLGDLLGPDGSVVQWAASTFGSENWLALNANKLLIAGSILLVTTFVTWSYDAGRWGIKVYEVILKLMVAGIVVCFFGVIWALRSELNWGQIAWGFLPDLRKIFEPSDQIIEVLKASQHGAIWTTAVVREQRELMISAAATAVGINMTFLFPYSLLAKGWNRDFRGLAIFDLSTGMLIPFMLATSCVVVAAANQFHAQPVAGFMGELDEQGNPIIPDAASRKRYDELLTPIVGEVIGAEAMAGLRAADEPLAAMLGALNPEARQRIDATAIEAMRAELGRVAIEDQIDRLPVEDRRIAAMLIRRNPFDLAKSLSPFTGDRVANVVFGLGVLGMTISTITLLMLISGFVICEIFNLPQGGWSHRLGCLAAATGALGPFIWGKAAFYLAVYVSVFGMMLLPIAYLSFFFLFNQKRLLGADMPRGGRRAVWNILLFFAATVATLASLYSVWDRAGRGGMYALGGLVGLALVVQIYRWLRPAAKPAPAAKSAEKSEGESGRR